MKKIISIFLLTSIILYTFLEPVSFGIDRSSFIDYNDINYVADMFDKTNKVLRTDTIDGVSYITKEIINDDKYKIVGTKSLKKISISIFNKTTKKLNIYEKKLLLNNNSLKSEYTFTEMGSIDLSKVTKNQTLERISEKVTKYNCTYLNYKYEERQPYHMSYIKFKLTKPNETYTTHYESSTTDAYKYSRKFKSHIKSADKYMKSGFEVGLGFLPGVGEASAVISIIEAGQNLSLESVVSALVSASELIPFWGDIISLSDMASKFVMANANCVLADSDFKKVKNS